MKLNLKSGKYTPSEVINNLKKKKTKNQLNGKDYLSKKKWLNNGTDNQNNNIVSNSNKSSKNSINDENNEENAEENNESNTNNVNGDSADNCDINIYFKELEDITNDYCNQHDIKKLSDPKDKIFLIKKYILIGKKIKGNTSTFHSFMQKISTIIHETIDETKVN